VFSAYIFNKGDSNLAFWHTPLGINKIKKDDKSSLGAYPQNFENKIGLIKTHDDRGVIMLDYKGDLGLQYNPNAIAQLSLGYYDKIIAGDNCINDFLTQASYFIDHGRMVDDVLLWEYEFPFEMRNPLSSPWRSALAQGQGISVCLRAYMVSGNELYLNAAKKAFMSFHHFSREHPGGVLDDSRGYTWLEEYIVSPPNHVLNGFIWALLGVYDYALYTNDDYAWDLWKSCLKTLRENLEHYDLGFWTSYDLVKFNEGTHPLMPCSIYYQNLHIIQMKILHMLTSDDVFKRYEERWMLQLLNTPKRIMSQIWKIYFKLRWF